MILLHTLQNRAFQFSLALLAKLENSTTMDCEEVDELAGVFMVQDKLTAILVALEQADFLHLRKEGSKWLSCSINPNGPKRPMMSMGKVEADYLQYILRLPEAKLFLDDATRDALMADVPKQLEAIQRICASGNTDPAPDPLVFRTVLEAVETSRYICYQYKTKGSTTYTETRCIPWKLEYSAYDHRWWVIFYNENESRTIKAVLANLKDVTLGEKHNISQEQILDDMDQLRMTEPIRLRIKDERGGLERCFLQFETQQIQSACCVGKDMYELTFTYYSFDTEEILRKLMQLGPTVTLLGPQSLKKELACLLRHALEKTRGKDLYETAVR